MPSDPHVDHLPTYNEATCGPRAKSCPYRILAGPQLNYTQSRKRFLPHMTPIRILLADDHTVVRDGLRAMLERESDMTVVAEAADGGKASGWLRRRRPMSW